PNEVVALNVSGLTSGNAAQGQPLLWSSAFDGGAGTFVTDAAWQVFDGTNWNTVAGNVNTYTPTEQDEGHQLRIAVSFTDAQGNTESPSFPTRRSSDHPNEVVALNVSGL